jgi:hypothetical protein
MNMQASLDKMEANINELERRKPNSRFFRWLCNFDRKVVGQLRWINTLTTKRY